MPLILVKLLEGRTSAQKKALALAIRDACVEHIAASPETVEVILEEVRAEHWYKAGESLRPYSARLGTETPAGR